MLWQAHRLKTVIKHGKRQKQLLFLQSGKIQTKRNRKIFMSFRVNAIINRNIFFSPLTQFRAQPELR